MAALAHAPVPFRLAARSADITFVTPKDAEHLRALHASLRQAEVAAKRSLDPLRIFADLVVFLDDKATTAASRKAHLDELDGKELQSDAHIFVGTPDELADLLVAWHLEGIAGFRLRPGSLPHDLEAITRTLVPILQRRGLFRDHYASETLRKRLGLERPSNRYASSRVQSPEDSERTGATR